MSPDRAAVISVKWCRALVRDVPNAYFENHLRQIAMRGKLVCKTVLRDVLRPGVLTPETINSHGQIMSRLFFADAAL